MGRMIDADALKEYIHNQDGRPFIGITIGEAFQMMVDEQPTIEERKTGEWIRKISVVDCATFVGDECSQCGYFKSMGQANFCPNCGADMRGGGQDE